MICTLLPTWRAPSAAESLPVSLPALEDSDSLSANRQIKPDLIFIPANALYVSASEIFLRQVDPASANDAQTGKINTLGKMNDGSVGSSDIGAENSTAQVLWELCDLWPDRIIYRDLDNLH
jgi:hypothetical protein